MQLSLRTLQNLFTTIKRTALYDLHIENKGKMVEFAGYYLPVQYGPGIIKQHLHCRSSTSIFDVSHMGQISITGKDRIKLLQRTTVGETKRKSIQNFKIHEAYLTMLLNQSAGIIDDCIVVNQQSSEIVRMVVNAGNKYQVINHLIQISKQQLYDVKINMFENQKSLIAVQGPKTAFVLSQLMQNAQISEVPFMGQFKDSFCNQEVIITRSGYTGEDGFEISAKNSVIERITKQLLKYPEVKLAGLGARDSLRLEAGLCLHGNDITSKINPYEANLMWTVYKKGNNENRLKFIGEEVLRKVVEDRKNGVGKGRKRIGFKLQGKGIVREGVKIWKGQREVGVTTSGVYSPCLQKCVGMGYIDEGEMEVGRQLQVEVRGKRLTIRIEKMPFLAANYYKNWSKLK